MKAKNMLKKVVVFSLCISMLTGCCFFEDEWDYEEEGTKQTSEIGDESKEDSSETEKKDEEGKTDSGKDETEEKDPEESSDVKEDDPEKTPESSADDKESTGESTEKEDEVKKTASDWIWAEIKENIDPEKDYSPKDDFHMYVNKDWLLNNNIPDGYASYSKYAQRQLDVSKEFMNLLTDETLTSDLAKQVQSVYKAILDWDARNELGYAPLEESVEIIENIDSIQSLYDFYRDPAQKYSEPLFSYGVGTDYENSDKYMFFISQASLLLGDAAEYTERTSNGELAYSMMLGRLEYMLPRLGKTKEEAKELLDKAIAFEALLAENSFTTEDTYSPDIYDRIINKMTVEEACALCPDFPVYDILNGIGKEKDDLINVNNPEYLKALGSIATDENLDGIKARYLVKAICSSVGLLDEETYRFNEELTNSLYGVEGSISDEEMASSMVQSLLPIQCQQLYVEVYGSEEKKELVTNTCKQVIETYAEMLRENDYLSKETIDKAVEKLYSIRINSLYPDKWPDVSGCDISGLSFMEAVEKCNYFMTEYNLSKDGQTVDKDMWADIGTGLSILECNAFYNPNDNSINMICGMMGDPFYNEDMSIEEIYASLGAFWIGHEISHAFDSSGCQFDKDGNYSFWWTEEDKAAFDKHIEKVINYMSSIEVAEGMNVIGEYVNTEIVADFTGLQCALRMASKIENFDYAKFFETFASMNVSISTEAKEAYQLYTDSHPLDYLRTNVPVQQFEEFYKAYDVKEGDGMYLAPEDRLLVW